MTNDLHQADENTGTMEVLERHQFDVSKLEDYMQEHVEGFEGKIKIEEFKGGQSNPTYKVITPNQSYVLRRKPPGKLLKSAHAVDREYRVITALNQTDVPVPKSYALCEDDDVIGTAFYLMEFKDGRVLWDPAMEKSNKDEAKGVYESMNDSMAKLHLVSPDDIGLSSFGKPGNYVGRQVSRWSKQYIDSETETIDSMNNLIDWLPNNLPTEKRTGIVHGDYSLTNVMIGKNDPIKKLAKEIIDGKFATEEELKIIEKKIDEEISESVKNAIDAPEPPSEELTKYIWAED